ncbi:MAG: two-component regulator propeller domain-containing protein [Calditrichota bacterium]
MYRLLICLIYISFLQASELSFSVFTKEDGLPSDQINYMLQDEKGFLWLATSNGLVRYDGYTFKIFQNTPSDKTSLSANLINFLYLGNYNGKPTLWIATESGGVNALILETETFLNWQNKPDDSTSISSNWIMSVLQRDSILWVGNNNNGLDRLDLTTNTAQRFAAPGLPISIRDILPDPGNPNRLFLGTSKGVYGFDDSNKKIFSIEPINQKLQEMRAQRVDDMHIDDWGNLWVGTYQSCILRANLISGHVHAWKKDPDAPTADKRYEAMSIDPAEGSNLWVSTFNSGLKLFNPRSEKFRTYSMLTGGPEGLKSNSIQKTLVDKSGQLWVASGKGLHKQTLMKANHTTIFQHDTIKVGSLNDNYVWSVYEDPDGIIWIGTSEGLNRYHAEDQTFTDYSLPTKSTLGGMISNALLAICEDWSGDYLWLGTFGTSLQKFHKKTGRIQRFDIAKLSGGNRDLNMIYDIVPDRDGETLWIATENGLRRFNTQTLEVLMPPTGKQDVVANFVGHIHALHSGENGSIWIGTLGNGMYQWLPSDSIYNNWRQGDAGLRSNSILDFATFEKDSGKVIWASASEDGVIRLELDTGEFLRFNSDDGLPGNSVWRLLPDSRDGIWVITGASLAYINPSNKAIESYEIPLASSNSFEFSSFAGSITEDGTLWSGGPKGLLKLDTDNFRASKKQPELQFTEFKIFDRPVKAAGKHLPAAAYSDELRLSWRDNLFSLEFSLMDYRTIDRARYFYKLDGFHDDFVASRLGNRVEFTNLDPGRYVLHVRGVNSSGGEATRQMSITITPPVWATWWFRALVIALVAALLYGLHRYRLNQMLKVERTRTRIARDLHDEVSANLSSINFFSDAVARSGEDVLAEAAQKYLGLINESASGAKSAMDDIIWAINPQHDDWGAFLARLRRYASDLLASREIDYNIQIPEDKASEKVSMEVQRDLWLIFKEIITNAIRHSECSRMEIKAEFDRKSFRLSIQDNGSGFDESVKTDRNGISNIRSRAADLKANIELHAIKGQGTTWRIRLPL